MKFLFNEWWNTDGDYANKEYPKLGAVKELVTDGASHRECWVIEITSIEQLINLFHRGAHGDMLLSDSVSIKPHIVIRLDHECE